MSWTPRAATASGRWWGSVPPTIGAETAGLCSTQAGRPKLTDDFEAFRGTLGIRVIQCRPRDPEAKGLVERANGYLETSFLPGRRFTGPADFDGQLQDWLVLANRRQHRALGCRPVDRLDADRAAMLTLPPVSPALGWSTSLRLPRDHYVRLDSNDYSVHPAAVGRRVEVSAGLATVTVTCAGRQVARHIRCWARHQSITDAEHVDAARTLRRETTTAVGKPAVEALAAAEVETRSLSAYDAAFGLNGAA